MSDNSPLLIASTKPTAKQLYTQMTEKQQPDKAQLFFVSSVLNRYREDKSYRIIRTDTTGRVSKQGVWSADFGISGDDDSYIHLSAQTWVYKIPKSEQEHWLTHMITLPMSDNYLRGVIRPGCIDDGAIRTW